LDRLTYLFDDPLGDMPTTGGSFRTLAAQRKSEHLGGHQARVLGDAALSPARASIGST
jgi:hypothetical protein